jgi:outer membrane protein assembly factor BamB
VRDAHRRGRISRGEVRSHRQERPERHTSATCVSRAGPQRCVSTARGIDAGPAVDSANSVYFGDDSGRFYAVSAAGKDLWPPLVTPAGSWNTPSVIFLNNKSTVFAPSSATLIALDAATGNVIWRDPSWFNGQYVSQPAVVPGGVMYISNSNQYAGAFLYAVDSLTGDKEWSWSNGSLAALQSPAVGPDGAVYVTSYDGNLYQIIMMLLREATFRCALLRSAA